MANIKKNKHIYLSLVLLAYAFIKIRFGLQSDEAHQISIGDQISRGDAFFKDSWFYLQFSATITAPIIALYRLIVGSNDGILLFFRALTVLVQVLLSVLFIKTFEKEYDKNYVYIAAALFFMYVPDFQSFTYKQEVIWFLLIMVILAYRYLHNPKKIYLIFMGITVSAAVLAYPTAILLFVYGAVVIIYEGYKGHKIIEGTDRRNAEGTDHKNAEGTGDESAEETGDKSTEVVGNGTADKTDDKTADKTANKTADKARVPYITKNIGIYIATCALLAILFLSYVLSRISVKDMFYYLPIVIKDDNLDSSFATKLIHPVVKYVAIGLFTAVPVLLSRRVRFIKDICTKIKINVPALLLVLAFLGQCFIQRRGITWHCITYPYVVTCFLFPLMDKKKGSAYKEDMLVFEVPTLIVVLSMALASNQGNITSMYPAIITAMALVLSCGYSKDNVKDAANDAAKDAANDVAKDDAKDNAKDDAKCDAKCGASYDSKDDVQNYAEISSKVGIKNNKKWNLVATILLVMAAVLYIPLVYEQESVDMDNIMTRTVFLDRIKMDDGPCKGLYLAYDMYPIANDIEKRMDEYVNEDDLLFVIDDYKQASIAYLDSKGDYATYSPQGGWGLGFSDRAVRFFTENTDKKPSVVMISKEYIGSDLDTYITESAVGAYLKKEGFAPVVEDDKYYILR